MLASSASQRLWLSFKWWVPLLSWLTGEDGFILSPAGWTLVCLLNKGKCYYATPWVKVLNSASGTIAWKGLRVCLLGNTKASEEHLCFWLFAFVVLFFLKKRASQETLHWRKGTLALRLFTKSVLLDELNGRSHNASSSGCWSMQSTKPRGLCCACGSCLQWMA